MKILKEKQEEKRRKLEERAIKQKEEQEEKRRKEKEREEKRTGICENIIKWLETHNGNLPRSNIKKEDNTDNKAVAEMTEEEHYEVNLYINWLRSCKEKEILEKYAGKPIENVPEEYREKIAKLRKYGLGLEENTPITKK